MEKNFSAYRFLLHLLFGVFSLPFFGQAQGLIPFKTDWKKGTILLTNGDTLSGKVGITMPNDIVSITPADGTSYTFLPADIVRLEVRELENRITFYSSGNSLKDRREYRQFSWNHDKDYGNFKSPALFIVLASGKHSLLLREEKHQQKQGGATPIALAANLAITPFAEQMIYEKFYLAGPSGEVKYLRKPKRDLLATFPAQRKLLLKYAQENGLNFNNTFHLAQIVAYGNTL